MHPVCICLHRIYHLFTVNVCKTTQLHLVYLHIVINVLTVNVHITHCMFTVCNGIQTNTTPSCLFVHCIQYVHCNSVQDNMHCNLFIDILCTSCSPSATILANNSIRHSKTFKDEQIFSQATGVNKRRKKNKKKTSLALLSQGTICLATYNNVTRRWLNRKSYFWF